MINRKGKGEASRLERSEEMVDIQIENVMKVRRETCMKRGKEKLAYMLPGKNEKGEEKMKTRWRDCENESIKRKRRGENEYESFILREKTEK